MWDEGAGEEVGEGDDGVRTRTRDARVLVLVSIRLDFFFFQRNVTGRRGAYWYSYTSFVPRVSLAYPVPSPPTTTPYPPPSSPPPSLSSIATSCFLSFVEQSSEVLQRVPRPRGERAVRVEQLLEVLVQQKHRVREPRRLRSVGEERELHAPPRRAPSLRHEPRAPRVEVGVPRRRVGVPDDVSVARTIRLERSSPDPREPPEPDPDPPRTRGRPTRPRPPSPPRAAPAEGRRCTSGSRRARRGSAAARPTRTRAAATPVRRTRAPPPRTPPSSPRSPPRRRRRSEASSCSPPRVCFPSHHRRSQRWRRHSFRLLRRARPCLSPRASRPPGRSPREGPPGGSGPAPRPPPRGAPRSRRARVRRSRGRGRARAAAPRAFSPPGTPRRGPRRGATAWRRAPSASGAASRGRADRRGARPPRRARARGAKRVLDGVERSRSRGDASPSDARRAAVFSDGRAKRSHLGAVALRLGARVNDAACRGRSGFVPGGERLRRRVRRRVRRNVPRRGGARGGVLERRARGVPRPLRALQRLHGVARLADDRAYSLEVRAKHRGGGLPAVRVANQARHPPPDPACPDRFPRGAPRNNPTRRRPTRVQPRAPRPEAPPKRTPRARTTREARPTRPKRPKGKRVEEQE